jgi:hypothetical protein
MNLIIGLNSILGLILKIGLNSTINVILIINIKNSVIDVNQSKSQFTFSVVSQRQRLSISAAASNLKSK